MNTETILRVCEKAGGERFQLHYDGYAEPGYDDPESKLIATGDWNSRTETRRVYPSPFPCWLTVKDPNATYTFHDRTMPRIGAILEKLGVELEWEDEWVACNECYKLIRTQPDSYSWLKSYWLQDGIGYYCKDCILDDPEDYLEYLDGNSRNADTLGIDLEKYGYQRVKEDYENGWYGIEDDPEAIADDLRAVGIEHFIFTIDCSGQFNTYFSIWVHKTEYDKLQETP